MRAFWIKVLKRAIPVAVVLGAMGYIFAEVFLMMHRMNGGTPDPGNDSVRWRTPLTMAGLGVGLLVFMELIGFALRRKPPVIADPAKPTVATVDFAKPESPFQKSPPRA